MSSTESTATPALPTSPVTRGGRCRSAVGGEVKRDRHALPARCQGLAIKALLSSAVEKPAYWRMVQGRAAYMVAWGPRTRGEARQGGGVLKTVHVSRRVGRLDSQALGRDPVQRVELTARADLAVLPPFIKAVGAVLGGEGVRHGHSRAWRQDQGRSGPVAPSG